MMLFGPGSSQFNLITRKWEQTDWGTQVRHKGNLQKFYGTEVKLSFFWEGGCCSSWSLLWGGGLLLGTLLERRGSQMRGLLIQIKFRVQLHRFKLAALPWAVASPSCARVLLQPHRSDTNMSQFSPHVKTHFMKINVNIIHPHSS